MPPVTQRFLIAPYNSGLQNNVKPFLIPEDAFEQLENMYVWRGRVKKRLGSQLLFNSNSTTAANAQLYSRLRIDLGVMTDGSGNRSGTVPGAYFAIGQMFSIGDQLFTVYQTGTPAAMLNTGIGTATYNTSNGDFTFTGVTPGTEIFFYPAQPVMGFAIVETTTINYERYLAFDQQFSYEYGPSTGWTQLDTGAATWTGNNSDFFYSSMYRGAVANDLALFTTNNTTADGIRYFVADTNTWTQFTQSYSPNANTQIVTARIVLQFKGRLLLFNTWEQPGSPNPVQYPNRVRYSQIGSPIATNAWYDADNGYYSQGGVIDAPTQEQIISAQIFRDRMIVYFERSTWELVYTNNEIQPFRWQNINIELGSESTFSLVPFDRGIMGIAEVGVHTTNGINVQRIDDKIPDYIFSIQNLNNGPERVQGIRDYFNELVYWTLPTVDSLNTPTAIVYPNQLLVYNYQNGAWATWDDSITAFGYINLNNALSWSELTYLTWENWTTEWNSGANQARMLRVMGGNQEGYTFFIDRDTSRCAPALQITNITIGSGSITLSVINNNMASNLWILLENIQGTGDIPNLNGQIYPVIANGDDTITIIDSTIKTGTYKGGGTVALVPQINMQTKQYNFYADQGVNFSINKVDFLIDSTSAPEPPNPGLGGQVQVNFYPSTGYNPVYFPEAPLILETTPYNSVYYPYESSQNQLWHSLYPQLTGSFIQLRLFWNSSQMIDPTVSLDNFTLHSMMFYATPTDTRFQ